MKATEKATTTDISPGSKKGSKPAKKKKLNLKEVSQYREPLKAAGEKREACNVCGLFSKCHGASQRYKLPDVPELWSGSVLIVTEGNESKGVWRLLRRMWRKAGWRDDDIATVAATRCGSGSPSMAQLRACRPFLLQVVHKLKPKHILGLGSTAMRALRNDGETNLTKNRGKEIRVPGL